MTPYAADWKNYWVAQGKGEYVPLPARKPMEKTKLNHAMSQQRLFFLLISKLKTDPKPIMDKAKRRFDVTHMSELSKEQMNLLIKSLKEKIKKKNEEAKTRMIKYRVYSKRLDRFLKEADFDDDKFHWDMNFSAMTAKMEVVDSEGGELDVMESSGKLDHFGIELYQYDIFIDRERTKWMLDWSLEQSAWIGVSFLDNTKRLLFTFNAIKKVGSIYEEVLDE